MNFLLIDTNVIIRRLRRSIPDPIWNERLSGRAPVISPVTAHELRRGVRPGSPWEKAMTSFPAPLTEAPTPQDWIEAGDLIRKLFWNSHKGLALSRLQNDALIAVTARRLGADVWSSDGDIKLLCGSLRVRLLTD